MKDEVVYIKVPVDEWSVPDGWTNPDPEDPDYIREEFFAIGNHSTITTVWSESHLQGITHLLVEVPLSELIKRHAVNFHVYGIMQDIKNPQEKLYWEEQFDNYWNKLLSK